jgi:2-methylisocitrate lyase-like PEP mutase family enzyme
MEIRKQAEKAARFRELHHEPRVLVLVNVWDVATARLVEEAGFRAIATSSAAVANSWGYPDGERISRVDMLSVVERIARHVQLPVSADLEAGYGGTDEAVTELAYAMIAAGAVGLNFEDATGDVRNPLFPIEQQVERIKRLREVSSAIRVPVVINARTDVYLAQVGEPETRFEHAVSRVKAYRQAGADCLFVPGVRDGEIIGRLVEAVEGPLNILAGPGTPPVTELARLGVARVSFGSGPFRAAMGWFRKFLHEASEPAALVDLAEDAIPYGELNKLLEN